VHNSLQPNTNELLQLYQNSDLFVLPSLGECFGIATIEAMAAGLPVIATSVGGTADIIDEGRNGYIVPCGDVAALSGAIGRIMTDESLRRQMARQSRMIAEERFDLRRNAHRTFEHLRIMARDQQQTSMLRNELPTLQR
jgi:glycosyltransferase involved in cell wall biosynthesis